MRSHLVLIVFGIAACASDRVTPGDGRAFLRIVNAATATTEDDLRMRLLFQGCSELRSCAAGCDRELSMSAEALTDPSQRAALLAQCFGEYRKARAADAKLSAEAWFRGYVGRYGTRARAALAGDERRQLDAGLNALGLARAP